MVSSVCSCLCGGSLECPPHRRRWEEGGNRAVSARLGGNIHPNDGGAIDVATHSFGTLFTGEGQNILGLPSIHVHYSASKFFVVVGMGGSQSVRPIEETVILHLKAVGKYFGGKGQYGVKKSEAMQVIRYVVNSTDTDEKPYRLLAEAFAASDISAEADDDDIA
eukprot:2598475-Pyramimonas_sp.AAC.1